MLYRRWPTKQDLVKAAIASCGFQQTIEIPNAGTLCGDLIEFMSRANGS